MKANRRLILFVTIGVLVWLMQNWSARCAEETALTESAEPRTLAELNDWYIEPPTNQNAATYFLQGVDALDVTEADYTNLPFIGNLKLPVTNSPLSRATKAAVTDFIRRNQRIWPFFEQGAKCEQSRYPVDFNSGPDTPLPLGKIVRGARAAALFALGRADARQAEAAGKSLLIGFALSRALEAGPCVAFQYVRASCLKITTESLEQVLNRAALPLETLDRLQQVLNKMEKQDASGTLFRRSLIGQRVISLSCFDLPPEKFSVMFSNLVNIGIVKNYTLKQLPELKVKLIENVKGDRQFFDETYSQILTAWKQDYPQRLEAYDICSARIIEATNRQFILSSMLLIGPDQLLSTEATLLANLRLAQTAVALERFRATHGNRYPEVLSVIAPDYLPTVPRDPFANGSLEYRKTKSGYLLYSVGSDRKDDSGSRKDDLVFQVINPPPAIAK